MKITLRLIVSILSVVFVFQILEIPPPSRGQNPKTCCGKPVCLCTHPKGAFCPFKHKIEQATRQPEETVQPKRCHLHGSEKSHHGGQDKIRKSREDVRSYPLFQKAPCDRDAPRTTLAGTSREFILASNAGPFLKDRIENLPLSSFQFSPLLQSKKIDPPPKSSVLSIFF